MSNIINYKLKLNPRGKNIRLTIKRNLEITVSAPLGVRKEKIDDFVFSRQAWISKQINELKINQQKFDFPAYHSHRARSRFFVLNKIKEFNLFYNFPYNKVRVKNNSSNWGSCSLDGNLNFNYRLLFIPEHLSDYVIVHELCHLKELNHSSRFWELVAQTINDFKKRRQELKKIII